MEAYKYLVIILTNASKLLGFISGIGRHFSINTIKILYCSLVIQMQQNWKDSKQMRRNKNYLINKHQHAYELTITNSLSWNEHINNIIKKYARIIYMTNRKPVYHSGFSVPT